MLALYDMLFVIYASLQLEWIPKCLVLHKHYKPGSQIYTDTSKEMQLQMQLGVIEVTFEFCMNV